MQRLFPNDTNNSMLLHGMAWILAEDDSLTKRSVTFTRAMYNCNNTNNCKKYSKKELHLVKMHLISKNLFIRARLPGSSLGEMNFTFCL